MTLRHGSTIVGNGRSTNLARAALRRLRSQAGKANMPTPAAPGARPFVDFLDPVMRHAALQAKGIGLDSFLVTLAAFQRGLKVTFYYERASIDRRYSDSKLQGHRGEIFSISDGSRCHVFSRTMGDMTDRTASAVAEDKHLTKAVLRKAGVRVPEGIVVSRDQGALIEEFLARRRAGRFVVKPFDGSLSRGVEADLVADEVHALVQRQQGTRIIVEEFIVGAEYRATVVGDRCVAVSQRSFASVIGDGHSSITELIAAENSVRATHPHMAHLNDQQRIEAYLSRTGLSGDTIPDRGHAVRLINTAWAAAHTDVTDLVVPTAKTEAVRAVQALGLPNGGVDLLVTAEGQVFVLEVNQRAFLGAHSFPREGHGQGNRPAEALVDLYFPDTATRPTHHALAYDFAAVRAALETAQVAEISLPVVGSDWRVLRISEKGFSAGPMMATLQAAARATGVFFMMAPLPCGGASACVAYAPVAFSNLLDLLPPPFRARLLSHVGTMDE